ncbi:MAG: hypothetical protein JO166_21110 [Deltaproteobacteria bacterium]|nr:hypothetical protein [Deltaproteobacteria bacterium]
MAGHRSRRPPYFDSEQRLVNLAHEAAGDGAGLSIAPPGLAAGVASAGLAASVGAAAAEASGEEAVLPCD